MEALLQEEVALKKQLEVNHKQEEVLWRQKSRIQWIQEGEQKTKFFHRVTIQHWHNNHITHLVTEQCQTLHKHVDLEQELVSYYQDLLSEPPIDRSPDIENITQHIPNIINQEQNEALSRPIMIEEVDLALQHTLVGKAPGLDGFMADLFHFYWPMFWEEFWDIIEDSHIFGQVLPALNSTFLTLIPK